MLTTLRTGLLLWTIVLAGTRAEAATIVVPPGEPVQAAVDAAVDGDVIDVAPGEHVGDLDFLGKAVTVRGAPGHVSILRGTGAGPVVTFASGEAIGSRLEGLTITGGVATNGGGVFISGASPLVVRNRIFDNRARASGSGAHVEDSTAWLLNNLIVYNRRIGAGDPHGVQVRDASPLVLNNVIVRSDSNGLLIGGVSAPYVWNNVFAHNAGRGICDFSGGGAQIQFNVFHRNQKAALLTSGTNYQRIANAEAAIGAPRLAGNLDGDPGFVDSVPRGAASGDANYSLRPDALARDAGHPAAFVQDLDGSRNDIGWTGGPLGVD